MTSKKSLMRVIMSTMGLGGLSMPVPKSLHEMTPQKGNKGQIRSARPKASGAAQLKRQAKKRRNIRKNK